MRNVTLPISTTRETIRGGGWTDPDADLRRTVGRVVKHSTPIRMLNERRSDRRFPLAIPVLVTPLEDTGTRRDADSISVIARNLSERGLDFYHQSPVADRYMIAWLPVDGSQCVGLVIELTWCRFSGLGWYENGGRFVAPPSRMVIDYSWTAGIPRDAVGSHGR